MLYSYTVTAAVSSAAVVAAVAAAVFAAATAAAAVFAAGAAAVSAAPACDNSGDAVVQKHHNLDAVVRACRSSALERLLESQHVRNKVFANCELMWLVHVSLDMVDFTTSPWAA